MLTVVYSWSGFNKAACFYFYFYKLLIIITRHVCGSTCIKNLTLRRRITPDKQDDTNILWTDNRAVTIPHPPAKKNNNKK